MEVRQVFEAYDHLNPPPERHKFCPVCGTECSLTQQYGMLRVTCASCGYIYYRNPSPAVSILVVDGSNFLLCKRSRGTLEGGKWSLVGGFMEFNEDFLTAGIREVKEETGLNVEIKSILSVVTNFFRPDLHTLVVVLLAKPVGGELCIGDTENDEVRWFSLEEGLPEMAFEADAHIIRRYFETRLEGVPVDEDYARSSPNKSSR
jgi:NADH pyrophosphatase NudC (nudix superfamily)